MIVQIFVCLLNGKKHPYFSQVKIFVVLFSNIFDQELHDQIVLT